MTESSIMNFILFFQVEKGISKEMTAITVNSVYIWAAIDFKKDKNTEKEEWIKIVLYYTKKKG